MSDDGISNEVAQQLAEALNRHANATEKLAAAIAKGGGGSYRGGKGGGGKKKPPVGAQKEITGLPLSYEEAEARNGNPYLRVVMAVERMSKPWQFQVWDRSDQGKNTIDEYRAILDDAIQNERLITEVYEQDEKYTTFVDLRLATSGAREADGEETPW